MSEQLKDVIPDSRKGDNIFDTYIMFIEAQRLRRSNISHYDFLFKIIEVLDRNLVDLESDKSFSKEYKTELNEITFSILKEWFPILNFYKFSGDFVYALSYNFYGFSKAFAESWRQEELRSLAAFFSPSIDYKSILNEEYKLGHTNRKAKKISLIKLIRKESSNKLDKALDRVIPDKIIEQLEFTNYKIFHRVDNYAFEADYLDILDLEVEELRKEAKKTKLSILIGEYQFRLFDDSNIVWEVKITTDEKEPKAIEFIGAIYNIVAGIEAISDNVEVKIIDWGNGSKWVKLQVQIKDFFAREDVKSVVDKGIQAATAKYLDAPIAEVQKTQSEIEKINRETSAIPEPSLSSKMYELELQTKELSNIEKVMDLESKRLDNQLKKLELIRTASEMIKSGLVKGDSTIQLEINDILIFANNKHIPFTTMNEIDERASLQPKDEKDEPIS